MVPVPNILALDFDGVICDGLVEYFQTAWAAYCQIWQPEAPNPPDGLAERFYALRPVVESGWEMPLVLRSLLLGTPDAAILDHWADLTQPLLETEGVDKVTLAKQVDSVRDRWIAQDLENWLAQHRFYPGVMEALCRWQASSMELVIITTKEGRFVRQLLQQQGVRLDGSAIFGKEVGQPKTATLQSLQYRTAPPPQISFVEDRLKTLQQVSAAPDLTAVNLFLADWGYNTERDRAVAKADRRIHLLSLDQLAQPVTNWTSDE
jgi:phosphoglycolate phosphatase-like HAD superfamily hydrolase